MSGGMFRLPDEAALNEMLARSHVRVARPLGLGPGEGGIRQTAPHVEMTTQEGVATPGTLKDAAAGNVAKPRRASTAQRSTNPRAQPERQQRGERPGRPDYESVLCRQIARAGLPMPERQFRFHEGRKWRVDIVWPDRKVAVEIEGMAHRTRERFLGDMEKYNELTLGGWLLVRVYTRWIATERAEVSTGIAIVRRALESRQP